MYVGLLEIFLWWLPLALDPFLQFLSVISMNFVNTHTEFKFRTYKKNMQNAEKNKKIKKPANDGKTTITKWKIIPKSK